MPLYHARQGVAAPKPCHKRGASPSRAGRRSSLPSRQAPLPSNRTSPSKAKKVRPDSQSAIGAILLRKLLFPRACIENIPSRRSRKGLFLWGILGVAARTRGNGVYGRGGFARCEGCGVGGGVCGQNLGEQSLCAKLILHLAALSLFNF